MRLNSILLYGIGALLGSVSPAAGDPPVSSSADAQVEVIMNGTESPAILPDAKAAAADHAADSPVASLFFSPEDMEAIRQALAVYASNGPVNSTGPSAAKTGESTIKSTRYIYPQFFLESLVYHSIDEWAIQINGQKIIAGMQLERNPFLARLQVIDIDHDKVTLEWKPDQAELQRAIEVLEKTPNAAITFNSISGAFQFRLHVNQTFSAYAMQVLEGKLLPVTEAIKPPAEPPLTEVEMLPPKAANLTPAAPVNNKNIIPSVPADQGLTGLINRYQHIEREK